MKYPVHITRQCRGRMGLSLEDESQDALIDKMAPDEVFRECCGWTLGYREWATLIKGWIKDIYGVTLRGGQV